MDISFDFQRLIPIWLQPSQPKATGASGVTANLTGELPPFIYTQPAPTSGRLSGWIVLIGIAAIAGLMFFIAKGSTRTKRMR